MNMAYDEGHFEVSSFWTVIRRLIINLIEYNRNIALSFVGKRRITLEAWNRDINLVETNIDVKLEEG